MIDAPTHSFRLKDGPRRLDPTRLQNFRRKACSVHEHCKMFKASRLSSPLMEWSGRAPAAPVRSWDEASLKRSTTMSNKSTAMGWNSRWLGCRPALYRR